MMVWLWNVVCCTCVVMRVMGGLGCMPCLWWRIRAIRSGDIRRRWWIVRILCWVIGLSLRVARHATKRVRRYILRIGHHHFILVAIFFIFQWTAVNRLAFVDGNRRRWVVLRLRWIIGLSWWIARHTTVVVGRYAVMIGHHIIIPLAVFFIWTIVARVAPWPWLVTLFAPRSIFIATNPIFFVCLHPRVRIFNSSGFPGLFFLPRGHVDRGRRLAAAVAVARRRRRHPPRSPPFSSLA
mmetsp:Transcript_41835/g.89127  ORF Transcript_41835/g.89127 Transcript_41835/m.89127 type:complete len:238 (-) Transcript_41835:408-1121(-)